MFVFYNNENVRDKLPSLVVSSLSSNFYGLVMAFA